MTRIHGWILVGAILITAAGCARVDRMATLVEVGWTTGGDLLVEGQTGNRNTLEADFDRCLYQQGDNRSATVLLIDGDPRSPRQAVVIRLLWMPEAGATPVDRHATNATITHVIFAGREDVGIYAGGAFLLPSGEPGDESLGGRIRDSNLRLTDSTQTFVDQLGLSKMTGTFVAQRDDAQVGPLLRQINQLIRERLGYARLVKADLAGNPEG